MQSSNRMLRLLQGDVGSGKTVVAAMAEMHGVECGVQAAPSPRRKSSRGSSEKSQSPLLDGNYGVRAIVLTGRDTGKAREALLMQIADGSAQIIIGTHAIFSKDVEYRDLGLAIIDEHLRQRTAKAGIGRERHGDRWRCLRHPYLRTAALTAYGDIETASWMKNHPAASLIDTRLYANDKLESLAKGLSKARLARARDIGSARWLRSARSDAPPRTISS